MSNISNIYTTDIYLSYSCWVIWWIWFDYPKTNKIIVYTFLKLYLYPMLRYEMIILTVCKDCKHKHCMMQFRVDLPHHETYIRYHLDWLPILVWHYQFILFIIILDVCVDLKQFFFQTVCMYIIKQNFKFQSFRWQLFLNYIILFYFPLLGLYTCRLQRP